MSAPDQFSLYDALFDALVEYNDEFIQVLMERVDMKTFLDEDRLNSLYTKVIKIAHMHMGQRA